MCNMINKSNIGLVIPKISKEDGCVYISNHIITHKACSAYDSNSLFPLYIYSNSTNLLNEKTRIANLNSVTLKKIENSLNMTFVSEKISPKNLFSPIDLLDYIYAVLYSPSYREKYKEFLKTSFPRIPYPTDTENFWQLVKLGGELRKTHLLEMPVLTAPQANVVSYPINGNHEITKLRFELVDKTGRVYINETQYFEGVPELAWNFYIGGYQPAQKWLQDRKSHTLTYEDILHYQKIIHALIETERLMREIDKLNIV